MQKEYWTIKKISVFRSTNKRTEKDFNFKFETKYDGLDKIDELENEEETNNGKGQRTFKVLNERNE